MPKIVAVTAAVGDRWRAYAKLLTDRMNQLAAAVPDGLTCVDISDQVPWKEVLARHVFLCKLHIWDILPKDVEGVLWVDSDVFPKRAVHLGELPTAPLAGVDDPWQVLDRKSKALTRGRQVLIGLKAYFNAGIFWMTREAIPLIEASKKDLNHLFRRSEWPDQDIFNWEAPRILGRPENDGMGWVRMDPRLNVMIRKQQHPDPILIHFCALQEKFQLMDAYYGGVGIHA